MAIGTDAAVEFFGTQDALDTTSSAVTSTSFSDGVNDLLLWTNDDDAPMASITLECTFASTPTVGSSVNLYARTMNSVSTSDADAPDANFLHIWLGAFPVNDVTSAQFITIDVLLPNYKTSSEFQFYIENTAGQTISAGWDLHVTPKAFGPAA